MEEINTLQELAFFLKAAIKNYEQHDYEMLRRKLRGKYAQFYMEAILECHPGWTIVENNDACTMYLYRNWILEQSAAENAAQFIALADDLLENYEDCESNLITADIIAEAMGDAERAYDFSNHVLNE